MVLVQFAEDISREVIKREDAVRRIKSAVVASFEAGVKHPRSKCCDKVLNYTVDPRFPGKVTSETAQ